MKHFLYTEWKTIVVAVLIGLGLLLILRSENVVTEVPGTDAEADVIPGERLGELVLGANPDAVVEALGEPTKVEELELGLEARHFSGAGAPIVYVKDDAVVGLERDLRGPGLAGVLPSGQRLTHGQWSTTSKAFGAPIAGFNAPGEMLAWSYWNGLAVLVDRSGKDARPQRVRVYARVAPEERGQ